MTELYLFLGQMGMGGIETLQLKVMNELIRRGRKVMLAGRAGELSHLLATQVDVIRDPSPTTIVREVRHRIPNRAAAPRVSIVSMHTWELIRASILNRRLSRLGCAIRGFHLVTHPRAYFFETRFPVVLRLLRRAFFRSPRGSTYFMNVAARDAHQIYWKTDLSGYPILTLPLAAAGVTWQPSHSRTLRIVSVGRLVPFKGYNRAAPGVVRTLRDSGIEVAWDIWGDGPDEVELAKSIEHADVGQWMSLKGPLPYEHFDATVVKHDLFVGMGTALLEAARLGMPAITAVEATSDETYGFLSETPLDSVGDRVPGAPTRGLADMIAAFARSSDAVKANIGGACRESALKRSSSVEQVADAVERSSIWQLDSSDASWLALSALLLAIQDFRKSAGL